MTRLSPPLAALALLLAGCGSGASDGGGNLYSDAAAEGESAIANEAEAAELANEAAADEAADTSLYGGNAAAGETGNAVR